jgi:N-acetylglutamate synthase-like GNAT family acetyltransferase
MAITIRQLDKSAEQYEGAEGLCELTRNEEMVPLTLESIDSHILRVGAFRDDDTIVGYSGITIGYTSLLVEFGGLTVLPQYRRHNIGSQLAQYTVMSALAEMPSETRIIAFGNKYSLPLLTKLGGAVVNDTTSLPKDCWKLCLGCQCENKPKIFSLEDPRCADTVIDITSISGGQ